MRFDLDPGPPSDVLVDVRELLAEALLGEPCEVIGLSGLPRRLPVGSWTAPVGTGDLGLLDRCVGATLDVGCGPGRMAESLAARGVCVLGIDVVPVAVWMTRARGASALVCDVFGPVPGEGRWDTVLLADGNIGIGGNPVVLLERVHDLLTPDGQAIVEVGRPGVGMRTHSLALVCGSARSAPFAWSLVGADAVREVADAAAMTVRQLAFCGGRWMAVLGKRPRGSGG